LNGSGTAARGFVAALPKAELHVHLEGSMRPHLLLDLARRRGVDLPADDEEGLGRWFQFEDFEHFIEVYLTCSRCLKEPEDFQLLLMDFARQQAAQNVVYSEVHFTISTHLANGANGDEIAHALEESIAAAEAVHGVVIRLIPDIVRNLDATAADRTIRWAVDHRSKGVVALGIAGVESSPIEPFRRHFEFARAEGLRTTAHSGEQCGPRSIRRALEVCQPERIGHGIAAVRDTALLRELAAAQIPLEVCPTSNICLGYAESPGLHPFEELRSAGVAVSISSDDPSLFGTSLIDEFCVVQEAFGYSLGQLAALARSSFEHAFLDEDSRADYLTRLDQAVAIADEGTA